MTQRTDLLTPAGRLVMGSLDIPKNTDAEGKPLVVKSGPNVGQPRVEFFFAVAIPKGAEQFWQQTPWGALIFGVGQKAFPQAHQSLTFAWKVKDGDSTAPNKKGKRPCDQPGYARHWVLHFSSGYAPKTLRNNGAEPMDAKEINLGDWVQVAGQIGDNGSQSQPGVFLNHSHVNFIGYGERISTGIDPTTIGFGVAMPAGASATPPVGTFNPAPAMQAAPVGFVPPVAVQPQYVAVQPNPAFLAPVPTPPAAPVARQMTAKAGGAPYESFIAQNWTDAALVAHGYMLA